MKRNVVFMLFISILLLCILPANSSAQEELYYEDKESGSLWDLFHTSDEHVILMFSKYEEGTVYKRVSSSGQVTATLNVPYRDSDHNFQYGNEQFIIVQDDTTTKLYNEKLQLVFQKDSEIHFMFEQVNNNWLYLYGYPKDSIQSVLSVIDLDTFKEVDTNEVKQAELRRAPLTFVITNGLNEQLSSTTIDNLAQFIPSGFTLFRAYNMDTTFYKGKFIVPISTRKMTDNKAQFIDGMLVFSPQGQLVAFHPLPANVRLSQSVFDLRFVHNRIFVSTSTSPENTSSIYEYQLDTGSYVKGSNYLSYYLRERENGRILSSPLNSTIYLLDSDSTLLYTIDVEAIAAQDSRWQYADHLYDKYAVVYSYDPKQIALYDLKSKKIVAGPFKNGVIKMGQNNQVMISTTENDNHKLFVQSLDAIKPDISGEWHTFGKQLTIDSPQHTLKVTLSQPIAQKSVTAQNVIVMDSEENVIPVKTEVNGKTIEIYAPAEGYKQDETYTLYVRNLTSLDGHALKQNTKRTFRYENNAHKINVTHLEQNVTLPKTMPVQVNGKQVQENVTWKTGEKDIIKKSTTQFEIQGVTQDTKQVVTALVTFQDAYLKQFRENILAPIKDFDGNEAMLALVEQVLIQFVEQDLYFDKDDQLNYAELLQGHLQGSAVDAVKKVLADSYFTTFVFNKYIEAEEKIAGCMSDLVLARLDLDVKAAGEAAESCADHIIDYLNETLDGALKEDDLSTQHIEQAAQTIFSSTSSYSMKDFRDAVVNEHVGMTGYWKVTYQVSAADRHLFESNYSVDIFELEEDASHDISGTRYMLMNNDFVELDMTGYTTQPDPMTNGYGYVKKVMLKSIWEKKHLNLFAEQNFGHHNISWEDKTAYNSYELQFGYLDLENQQLGGSYYSMAIGESGQIINDCAEFYVKIQRIAKPKRINKSYLEEVNQNPQLIQ